MLVASLGLCVVRESLVSRNESSMKLAISRLEIGVRIVGVGGVSRVHTIPEAMTDPTRLYPWITHILA